jgi:hypothetical protein
MQMERLQVLKVGVQVVGIPRMKRYVDCVKD